MSEAEDRPRDLSSLMVTQDGLLEATGEPFEPYRLIDPAGQVVFSVQSYLSHLQAAGRATTTQRSYGMDLLRWFRFLWSIEIIWDQATRTEARDFCRWLLIADKPARPHWRSASADAPADDRDVTERTGRISASSPAARPAGGGKYAAATRAHNESVLRHFYDFHLEVGTGPMVNPFPLARGRHGERAHAHHNPLEPYEPKRSGVYRPRLISQVAPRHIPDEKFNELFAALSCHRDRALVAFWISTGARASELLGVRRGDADPGQQLITVIRKGSRALQQLPASPDAFVWLRLYQAEMSGRVPTEGDEPLWWTLRRPFRPLTYHAAYRMFTRVNAAVGTSWTLHDLRHSAAYRMARDPQVPLTDVQWVLGHAHLSTTQLYVTAPAEDVIASVLDHYARRSMPPATPGDSEEHAVTYRSESLDVLFGRNAP